MQSAYTPPRVVESFDAVNIMGLAQGDDAGNGSIIYITSIAG